MLFYLCSGRRILGSPNGHLNVRLEPGLRHPNRSQNLVPRTKRRTTMKSRSRRQLAFYKNAHRRKMERETDIFFAPPAKARDEVLLRENSDFVGATATFGDAWEIVPRLNSKLPSGY